MFKDSIYLAIARIVEKHGLVSGVEEKGGEGAAVGAMIVKIIRVRLVRFHFSRSGWLSELSDFQL